MLVQSGSIFFFWSLGKQQGPRQGGGQYPVNCSKNYFRVRHEFNFRKLLSFDCIGIDGNDTHTQSSPLYLIKTDYFSSSMHLDPGSGYTNIPQQ